MARVNGLAKMSYAELAQLRYQVDAAMTAAREAEKKALKQEMEALAAKAGLSLYDVIGNPKGVRKAQKVAIKYRNPKDVSQTWTGRGRQPLWLAAALKSGKKLDSFRV